MNSAKQHLDFWKVHSPGASFVYILQAPPSTPIKVGFTNDIAGRVSILQTGNPYKLTVVCAIPGDKRLETLFHRKLGRDCRLTGEWFDGPDVPVFLTYAQDLAVRMVKAYKWPGPVDYRDVEPDLREKPKNPVTVRYVEPNPKSSRQEAQELRRAAFLGKHPLGRKPSRHNW